MSVLDIILPTHSRLGAVLREGPRVAVPEIKGGNMPSLPFFPGTGDRELDDAIVALIDMAREQDWHMVRHLGDAIAHRGKILSYQQTCDAEGVVRR